MPKTEFVLLTVVERVILSLTAEQKQTMVDCLRHELDPPINISEKFELNGNTYTATIMSNAWVVIYREDPWARWARHITEEVGIEEFSATSSVPVERLAALMQEADP